LECDLNKKFSRHLPESSVPEERVVAIRMRADRSARAGVPWIPVVADFYMELYPDMMERGYSLDDLSNRYYGEFWQ